MTDMLLVSDDLTGTFDAAAPFVRLGVEVVTSVGDSPVTAESFVGGARLVAINADTRHLSALGAFLRVSSIVEAACDAHVRILFKKTDSVLRGNVGAELSALWERCGRTCVHFIAAWPAMGRTTNGGIHCVDGVPVSESSFGCDPFEAVATSDVRALLRQQCDVPVLTVGEGEPAPVDFKGIAVYDATTEEEVDRRARELIDLGSDRLVLAGCAGLSRALARALGVAPSSGLMWEGDGGLLAFCGSVNAVTAGQCVAAREAGCPYIHISEDEKIDDTWLRTAAGRELCAGIVEQWDQAPLTVVDATDFDPSTPSDVVAQRREAISASLGRFLAELCVAHPYGRVLTTGGDVLLSLLEQLGTNRVRLLGEADRGIVATEVAVGDGRICVLSKSGGFGSRDLFLRLAEIGNE